MSQLQMDDDIGVHVKSKISLVIRNQYDHKCTQEGMERV